MTTDQPNAAAPGNRSIARNAGYLLATRLGSRALRIVYMIVLARQLGPELFGLLTYAQSWHLIFFSAALFGTGRLLIVQIGKDRADASAYVATTLSLRLITGIAASLGCALMALDPALSTQASATLLWFAAAVFARGIAAWAQHLFIAFEMAQLGLRQEWLFRSLEVLLGLALLAMGGGLLAIAIVHALAWALQAFSSWRLTRDRLTSIRLDWRGPALLDLARTAAPFMLVALSIAVLTNGGLVVYKLVLSAPADLGQLAILIQVLGLTLMLPKSLASAALPVLSRWVAAGQGDEGDTMRLLLCASIVGAAGLAMLSSVLAPILLPPLLGGDYRPATDKIGPTLWLLIPLGVGSLLNQLATAHGEYWWTAAAAASGALLMTITILVSAPITDLEVVLLGIGLGATFWAGLETFLAMRRRWLAGWIGLGRPLLAAGSAAGLFWLSRGSSPWLALLASVPPLALAFAGPRQLWRMGLARMRDKNGQ